MTLALRQPLSPLHRAMPLRGLLVLVATLAWLGALVPAARAEGAWTGTWRIYWRDTGAVLMLTQDGDRVTGSYPLFDGRLEGEVKGRSLTGRWSEGEIGGLFEAVISRDGASFIGRHDDREWFSGQRVLNAEEEVPLSLRTPQETMRAFVSQSARGRAGEPEAWGRAARAVDFGTLAPRTPRRIKLQHVRELYGLVDLTTFHLSSIPDEAAPDAATGDRFQLRLHQVHSQAKLVLTLVRDGAGDWRILLPSEDEMAAMRKELLAARGGQMRAADAFRKLQNPRDAMRALIEGTSRWDTDGKALALSALNLDHLPVFLRRVEGELAALTLRRVLSMVNFDNLQSVPDDGQDRATFQLFIHPEGRIFIAPAGPAADAPWQFTHDTVENIDEIYRAMDEVVRTSRDLLGPIPDAPYFRLRQLVQHHAPVLLADFGHAEHWQFLAAGIMLAASLVVAVVLGRMLRGAIGLLAGPGFAQTRGFSVSLVLSVGLLLAAPAPEALGMPESVRQVTLPFFGIVLTLSVATVVWHVLAALGAMIGRFAARSASVADDILFTLLLAASRLVVVVVAVLMTADFLSIPATSIVAGLGIGGLALAFASRETLSNVFGAGILVADRPFRRGDWIKAGEVEGAIEHVGIRSTRVRSADGSVMVVPNGTLADSVINNRGTRPARQIVLAPMVTAGATTERLLAFMQAVREHLESCGHFLPGQSEVGLRGIAADGITVEIKACVAGDGASDMRAARQALVLDIIRLSAEAGLVLGAAMQVAETPE